MQTKELIRKCLGAGPVAALLRAINSSGRLSEGQRTALYRRITKKVANDPDRVFRHEVSPGRTISIHLDGTIRRLYWTGTYEADTLPLFTSYARESEVILDIGAAEGIYALFAAAVNPEAEIFAFEASPGEQVRLQANLEANAEMVDRRVYLRAEALADYEGTADFYEMPGGTSSLNPRFRAGASARPVRVIAGDSVVTEVVPGRRVGLIKVDTESTEPAVLRGLSDTIERDRPVIFCEVLHGRSEADLQVLMDQWSYQSYLLTGEGPVHRRQIIGDPTHRHVNWLFLPNEAAQRQPAPVH